VCFANADGGTIVLGVNDKATTRAQALVGADSGYSLEVVRLGIFERTSPHLTTFAYEVEKEDVRILVVEVPPGVLLHANSAGRATRRVGKTCQPFTPDQQREVMMARGHFDWSAEPTGISTRDLSSLEVDRARTLLAEHRNDDLARLQRKPLLDALNLIAPDGTVSNAAVLLFGTAELIQEVVPAYGFSYQYRPTSGTEAVSRFRDARPLIAAIEAALFAVARRVEVRPLNLAGGIQVELADYPMDAVREIVVNAFIHRSYDSPGTVDLEHTSERFIVTSPGRLVSGVTRPTSSPIQRPHGIGSLLT
jgi:ATP-dependent DNA helicase RecG